jgi:alkanesulfonate monooxygenase SsuD/methylene tetrahydromethanopterin reductase-like flavin-dependent oxidoreductase (luciferase family)
VHIARDPADKKAALERRYQGHMRINALARRPDGDTRARFKSEAEARHESAESALFGTPDEIADKLDALRKGGVQYVIINFGGSRENIRRFAREIMPAFAGEDALALAGA